MIIQRSYETIEAKWLPETDEVSVELVIYPRWRTNGDADYFTKTVESLSGYIYIAICEMAGKNVNIEKRFEKFISSFTPISELLDDSATFSLSDTFKADDIVSGKAIKDIFKKQIAAEQLCNPSELSLVWAHSLLLLIPHMLWKDAWDY